MARVTVYAGRRAVATGETEVTDPGSNRQVENAGRAVCKARGKKFPNPATVRVQVFSNRWRTVAEVIFGG